MTTRSTRATLAVMVALAAAGCAQDSADLYAGEQSERDQLRAAINTTDRGWDTGSSRLLATHEGVEFYVVAGEEGDCLITFDPASAENRVAGCSTGGRVSTSGQVGVTTDFAADGLPGEAPEGWVRLTPQLQIETS